MIKTKIAVLISGGGTNLQALIDAQRDGIIRNGRIELVVSSNPMAYGLKRAEKAGIEAITISKKACGGMEGFEAALMEAMEKREIEVIVLAGFLKILSRDFVKRYENRIINVHPSLIPAFCGKGCYGLKVHEMALHYGVKVTGATVHFVNEIPDGGKIIMQKAVNIKKGDTAKILQKRVMAEAEWQILPQAVEMVCKDIAEAKEIEMSSFGANNIGSLIADNSYVGRGIVLGKSRESGKAVSAYFIMGRSDNSRNRIFAIEEGELYTRPFDESKVEDPSLIIYAAMRKYENNLIVTNGDQTDTIYEFLEKGKTFEEALKTRTFEPDSPNFTSRISGMITLDEDDFSYKLSILKSADKEGSGCNRYTFDYEPMPGQGHFIHTYVRDGNPLPAFRGEPVRVKILEDIDEFTELLWENLDADNKISLYVRYTDPQTGKYEDRLINKNQ